jgi:hypothetical protein
LLSYIYVSMKALFFISFLFATVWLHAQPSQEKLYGFQQRVTGGMKKAGDFDENGHFTKKETPDVFQYLIYLTSTSKATIHPVQLWVNGKAFSVNTTVVEQTPVIKTNPNLPQSPGTILVPKTAGTVLQLMPEPLIAGKTTTAANARSTKNAVVLLYTKGGKQQYAVLKKFSELPTVSLQ